MTNRERIIRGLQINDKDVLCDLLGSFCYIKDCDEQARTCEECIIKWLDSEVKYE